MCLHVCVYVYTLLMHEQVLQDSDSDTAMALQIDAHSAVFTHSMHVSRLPYLEVIFRKRAQ